MKRLNQILTTFVLCIFVLLSIAGCDFLDLEPKATETSTATFTVAPKLVEFSAYSVYPPDWTIDPDSILGSYNCMILTDEKTKEIFAMSPDEIEGFVYTEGYIYRIKVQVTFHKNIEVDPAWNILIIPTGYMSPAVRKESLKLLKILSKDKVNN